MAEINRLNTEQAALQENIHEVKKNTNEMADSVASLVFQIQAQSQDCNVLRSQIVQSPERIKREIVQKSESLEKEKGTSRDAVLDGPGCDLGSFAHIPIFFLWKGRLDQSANKGRTLAAKVEMLGAVEAVGPGGLHT
jgi:chromosome segregation ATPase